MRSNPWIGFAGAVVVGVIFMNIAIARYMPGVGVISMGMFGAMIGSMLVEIVVRTFSRPVHAADPAPRPEHYREPTWTYTVVAIPEEEPPAPADPVKEALDAYHDELIGRGNGYVAAYHLVHAIEAHYGQTFETRKAALKEAETTPHPPGPGVIRVTPANEEIKAGDWVRVRNIDGKIEKCSFGAAGTLFRIPESARFNADGTVEWDA